MCNYCEKEKTILKKKVISDFSWGWGEDVKIKESEASKYDLGVFIDRGYIRLVDMEDCQCMDGGEKIKIIFCPFCGEKIQDSK